MEDIYDCKGYVWIHCKYAQLQGFFGGIYKL